LFIEGGAAPDLMIAVSQGSGRARIRQQRAELLLSLVERRALMALPSRVKEVEQETAERVNIAGIGDSNT
jgi:hypothetical protein